MSELVQPSDIATLEAVIGDALTASRKLEIRGAGSKQTIGQTMDVDQVVSVSGLAGISFYEPEELVLAARAGTPLAEIQAVLAENNQQLAFEPPNWGPLLGNHIPQTVGGVIATNLSGPRRVQAGAARDHVLGMSMVTGRGEVVKTGGRVVKNVTGYDLCKLIAGSYGTLAVATDITLKVLPAGEKTRTVLVVGLDDSAAVTAMTKALSSPHDVSGAAFVPENLCARSGVSYVSAAGSSVTAIRVEGPGPSVEARCLALRDILGVYGDVEELHFHNSNLFWREIGDVSPFVDQAGEVWRLSVPTSNAVEVVKSICGQAATEFYLDWGGGLVWLRLVEEAEGGGAALIRGAVEKSGGHATLIRADDHIRSSVLVFQPQASGVKALGQRIKQGFDPGNILNPGRMNLPGGSMPDAD